MELYRRLLHERCRRPFAPARPSSENANGATANLATLNNGAASLFAKYRAGSLALRPKRALLFANFCMIWVKSICQFLYD